MASTQEADSESNEYQPPADWTKLQSGTVLSRVEMYEGGSAELPNPALSTNSRTPPSKTINPSWPANRTSPVKIEEGTQSVKPNYEKRRGVREPVSISTSPQPNNQSGNLTLSPEITTPTSPIIHGGVTAGIVNFGGTVVLGQSPDGDTGRSDRLHRCKQSYSNVTRVFNTEEEENFIRIVYDSTNNKTDYDIRSSFTHILKPIRECPSVDCAITKLNYKSEEHVRGASRKQITEYYAVTLKTVHEAINGHIEHHVMLLGGPGEGKSIAAKQYAKLVLEKKVPELRNVELVHYIDGSSLGRNRVGKPFELLFSNQLGSSITDSKITETGERWVAKNPDKVLLVIDGLNDTQYDLESPGDKISLNVSAKSFVVLCNLFRGDIYKGMWILSTSRWEWMWHLPRSVLPARAIELKGFPKLTAHNLLRLFVPSDKHVFIRSVMARFPALQELCSIPDFLLNVAKILNECECDHNELSTQAILLKILMYLKTSSPISARNPRFLYNVTSLAYDAAKGDAMEFSHFEAKNLDDANLNEIEHFLIVKPDPNNFDVTQESITKFQLRYRFRCKILRDILGALYVITRQRQEWKEITRRDLNTPKLNNIKLLVHGIVMDKSLSRPVETLTEQKIDFKYLSRDLSSQFRSKSFQTTLTDIETIHLLVACKGLQLRNPPTEIFVGKIEKPQDGHAILSAPRYYKQISRLRADSLQIDSSSLDLLDSQKAAKYEVCRLVISGEISHYELEKLSNMLMSNKNIRRVHLQYYSIEYNTERGEVLVDSMKKDDKEIIVGLLHHAPDDTKISVKNCRIAGSSKNDAIGLELMEELATIFKTHLHFIRVQDSMKKVPGIFIDMLKGTSFCSVGQFVLDSTNVSASEQPIGGNKGYKLTIHGNLSASNLIANVIHQGQWKLISTNDFLLTYEMKKTPHTSSLTNKFLCVHEEYQTTDDSYYNLCSLLTKLRCNWLIGDGWHLGAQYRDMETDRKVVRKFKLNGLNQTCFQGCRKFMLSSGADIIEMESYKLTLIHYEDRSPTIKIGYLDECFLNILKLIITEMDVNDIIVEESEFKSYAAIAEIMAIASQVKTQIDLLMYAADVSPDIDVAMALCQLTSCMRANFGLEENAIEIKEAKYIEIKFIWEEHLLAVLENIKNEFAHGTRIQVLNANFTGHARAVTEFQELVRQLSERECEVKVTKISLGCDLRNVPIEIVRLAAAMGTPSIEAANVQLSMQYEQDKTIAAVHLDNVILDDFRTFKFRFSWIPKMFVTRLNMSSEESIPRSLIDILSGRPMCTIDTLHSACHIGSIFNQLRIYMDSDKLQKISSNHHGGMTLTRIKDQGAYVLHAQKISVSTCDGLLRSFGEFQPNRIIIEEFEIGENQNDTFQKLADIEPDEMRKSLMECAKRVSQEKLAGDVISVETFCEEHRVSITMLHVHGDVSDLAAMISLSRKHGISEVDADNLKIRFCDPDHQCNCITLLLGKMDDIHRLHLLLGNEWLIIFDPLELGDLNQDRLKQNYLRNVELLDSERIKANSVKVSCDLRTVLDEMTTIQSRLTPNTITTLDYVLQIRYLQDNVVSLSPHPRGEERYENKQALTDFARKIEEESKRGFDTTENVYAFYPSSPQYETYETTPKQLQGQESHVYYECIESSQETSPKELFASDEYSF